ncbi:hypothetical protein A4E84_39510 [Streptomyces qaidamensis]|uniref:Uncharacterized protein n=1 Tax=Streptomyces qaidamensis TaxID=1783515 RepID=A0A143CC83_9ACTN|nr:hypothetical protein [Streptomyces qaidamensis]AMW15018.1 hypothetical protein A4E84_39510 [Streptomyces qaidamensis]
MFLRRPTPFGIVLRANLRRQAGPLAALVIAGVLVAVAWDGLYARGRWRDTGWVHIGEMCGLAARTVGVGFAVLLAGWQGGSEARDDAGWVATTSARDSVTCQLMGLVSGVAWPLAGYVLAMTVMVVSPYPQEPVGRAPLDLMAVDAVMLTAFSCVAYLVGRTVPLRGVSVPLTAAGLVLSVSPWGDPLLGPLTGLRFTYSGDRVPGGAGLGAPPGPAVWLPWCKAAVFAWVAASAVLLCARRWKTSIVLIVMLASALPLLALMQQDRVPGSVLNTREVRCRGHDPAVCVSSAYEPRRQRLEQVALRLSRRMEGAGPTHYLLTEDSSHACQDRDGVDSAWTVGIWARQEISLRNLAGCLTGFSPSHEPSSAEARALYRWLTRDSSSHGAAAHAPSAADRLARLTAPERATWIGRYLAAVEHGSRPPRIPDPDGERP